MPLTVSFFIAYTVLSFERKAPIFIGLLFIFEGCSNFLSVWYTFCFSTLFDVSFPTLAVASSHHEFSALWRIPFARPSWWAADKGCFLGLLIGICLPFLNHVGTKFIQQGKGFFEWILTRIFARLIPLFVLGFISYMDHSNIGKDFLTKHIHFVLWLLLTMGSYGIFLFGMSAQWNYRKMLLHIKNLLPAGGTALISGCSLSTMPWTIQGAGKNLEVPKLAQAIIPATTNIQQIGDCITNSFICFVLYKSFYGHAPDVVTWLHFTIAFVIARFATAAVLGGTVFILLPIYESYLGFTPELLAIILALNVVLDPLVTSSNVMANGALCRVFERFWIWSQEQIFSRISFGKE